MQRLMLTIMRHGHAEETAPEGDHLRALTSLGRREAQQTAQILQTKETRPERILISDAVRVKGTANIVLTALTLPPTTKVEILPELYLASATKLTLLLGHLLASEKRQHLFMIGHNPGLSELATLLTGQNVQLATGDAVILTIEAGNWLDALEMQGCWQWQS